MNATAMEVFLARLYTDKAFRGAFLAAPGDIARREGLDEDAVRALELVDRDDMCLAADSYAAKRTAHVRERGLRPRRLLRRLWALLER